MVAQPMNQGLNAAKVARKDEFYTQYIDIQKEKLDEMDADHVSAWSKGGDSSAENCQMLCITHNRAKGNR